MIIYLKRSLVEKENFHILESGLQAMERWVQLIFARCCRTYRKVAGLHPCVEAAPFQFKRIRF